MCISWTMKGLILCFLLGKEYTAFSYSKKSPQLFVLFVCLFCLFVAQLRMLSVDETM